MRRIRARSAAPLRPLGLWACLVSLACAAALGAGCAAELPEGLYGCEGGGSCPAGWRCFPDDRCYSPSFPGLELYAACDLDEDCAGGLCVRAYDTDVALGRCSAACTTSESCPATEAVEGVCAPGVGCLSECDDADDCGEGESCVVAPMTLGETACVAFDSPEFSGAEPCTVPGDCPTGTLCMRVGALDATGLCVWPCSPGGTCPPGATCEQIPGPIASVGMNPDHACLATCNATPGSCGALLTCAAFPGAGLHCTPPGWLP